jgi:HAT1-interacting factor 1
MQGVLGAMLGETKGQAQERLKEATAQANDLTGLVKKKKVKAEPVVEGKGKRKAEDAGEGSGKKAKVEDVKEEQA